MAFNVRGNTCSWFFKNSVDVIWTFNNKALARSGNFHYNKDEWQLIYNLKERTITICKSKKSLFGCSHTEEESVFRFQLCIIHNNEVLEKVECEKLLVHNEWKHELHADVFNKLMRFGQMSTLTVWCRILYPESKEHKSDDKGLHVECSDAGIRALSDDLSAAVETGQHSDVVLKLGEVTFPAHKVILSCRSKVFRAMFDHDCKENSDNAVDLVDMDVATAKSMLEYIYTGKVAELSSDNAIELYSVADRYCLTELVTQCREFMVGHVDVANMCEVAATADLHSDDVMMKAVQTFFRANLTEAFKSEKLKVLLDKNPHLFYKLVQEAVARDH